jgi:hypothetical protein
VGIPVTIVPEKYSMSGVIDALIARLGQG